MVVAKLLHLAGVPVGVAYPSVVPGFGMCRYVMLYTLVPPYHGSLGS